MEAVKLAPTLVPAAVLAAKFESEAHQVRRAMRIVEAAWLAHPHPDLADAYAHVRLGDSARQRLVRVETLAAKTPGPCRGQARGGARRDRRIRICQGARGAGSLARRSDPARGDADGRARAHRAWRQRQGADLDLARGARAARSGLDRGRLCQRSLASGVAGDGTARCVPVADAGGEPAVVRQGRDHRDLAVRGSDAGRAVAQAGDREQRRPRRAAAEIVGVRRQPHRTIRRRRRNRPRMPPKPVARCRLARLPAPAASRAPGRSRPRPRPRQCSAPVPTSTKPAAAPIPAVIPIVRAPDDPGIDDEAPSDEFTEQIGTPKAQAGGWRGFWARWGG